MPLEVGAGKKEAHVQRHQGSVASSVGGRGSTQEKVGRGQGKVESLILVQRESVSHAVPCPEQVHNRNPSITVY